MAKAQRVDEVRARGAAAVYTDILRQVLALRTQRWGNLWGYVFVGPAVLMYLLFQAWPIIRGFLMAFQDYRWLIPETQGLLKFNGLANYQEMLQDRTLRHSLVVSLKYTLMMLPGGIALSLFVAVMISKVRNAGAAGVYRVIAYLPVVLPISAAMVVWKSIYSPEFGYLNHFLRTYLRIQNPPNWLGSPKWTLYATVIPALWKSFGYNTLLFLIGIYNINSELYEAAAIDGAGEWNQFRHITIPSLKGIFTLILVLNVGLMSATEEMMILFDSRGGPRESALTAGLYLYSKAFLLGDMRMGYAASISLVLGLIHMFLSALVFKLMRTERA